MNAPPSLFPPIQPNRVERLKVSSLHELHVAEYGNPDGKPVVLLHGGPGRRHQSDHAALP